MTLTVRTGTDASPSSHLIGSYSIDGTSVVQRINGLVAGNVYTLLMVATTSTGESLSLFSHIPCEAVV